MNSRSGYSSGESGLIRRTRNSYQRLHPQVVAIGTSLPRSLEINF
ncbi:hypothetical protein [Sphaerothrix gracilis]